MDADWDSGSAQKKMGSFAAENRSYEKDLVSKKSTAFLCFL